MTQLLRAEEFPLPQIAKALAPYIRPRHEALRIRRILSIFLAQSMGMENPLSITSLISPGEDTHVKRIPPEVSGLRKNYLKAVQAQVKARDEYDRLTQELDEGALVAMRQEQQHIEDAASTHVITYLEFLQAQRKYQKLMILQSHLDLLAQKDAAQIDYLSMDSIFKEIAPAPVLPSPTSFEDKLASENTTKSLLLRLQKALLRAHGSSEEEKQSLAQALSEQQSKTTLKNADPPNASAQAFALKQTRDELVHWVEEQLAQGGQGEEAFKEELSAEMEETTLDIGQRKKAIKAKYDRYLQTRKSLLALLSAKRHAPLNKPAGAQNDITLQLRNAKKEQTENRCDKASILLPYVTEYLIPATSAQERFLQHESHLSKILEGQSQETVHVLERLAHESHLLSNYPYLASQQRFKNTVTALGGPQVGSEIGKEAESASLARAWAFASSAARSRKQDEVRERLEHGEKHAQIAKDRIRELRGILLGDVELQAAEKDEDQAGKQSEMKPSNKNGIWAGIDGNLSLHDDTSLK